MSFNEAKSILETAGYLVEDTGDIPAVLYHATPSCYINSIKKFGLGGKSRINGSGIMKEPNMKVSSAYSWRMMKMLLTISLTVPMIIGNLQKNMKQSMIKNLR